MYAALMLVRLQRWPSIEPALVEMYELTMETETMRDTATTSFPPKVVVSFKKYWANNDPILASVATVLAVHSDSVFSTSPGRRVDRRSTQQTGCLVGMSRASRSSAITLFQNWQSRQHGCSCSYFWEIWLNGFIRIVFQVWSLTIEFYRPFT